MSETGRAVANLLAENLSMNEIAHRLGLARSTVRYHAQALREANRERPVVPDRTAERHRPVAGPEVTRGRVRCLLAEGHSRARIAEMLGLARSTVTYHAGLLGEDIDERCARR